MQRIKATGWVALRVRMRNEKATATIWSFAVMKALGVALNPYPVADVLGGTICDATMVVTLGRIYGISINDGKMPRLGQFDFSKRPVW